jgi:hypothetical protein
MLNKDHNDKGSVEKKISGHEYQGVWQQDYLIGGTLLVVGSALHSKDIRGQC